VIITINTCCTCAWGRGINQVEKTYPDPYLGRVYPVPGQVTRTPANPYASQSTCTHHCHCPACHITVDLCPLLLLPCMPQHCHPVCCIIVALHTTSLLPCMPCHHCPMHHIIIALCTTSSLPCMPCHHCPVHHIKVQFANL